MTVAGWAASRPADLIMASVLPYLRYPLLIINLGLGLAMFLLTHQIVLVFVALLGQTDVPGVESNLGPFTYINQSVSIIWVIVLGIAALILFPLLDNYYEKVADSPRQMVIRFLKICGLQLVYIFIVFASIQVTAAFLAASVVVD